MRLSTMLTAITVAAFSHVAAADIVFSDTQFPTSGWGVESISVGGPGTSTVSQVLAGGNPGAYRQVDMTPGSSTGDAIYTLHRYGTTTATRYDPATQGAILALDFSIDYRDVGGTAPTTDQKVFFGAKQGTVVFAGPGFQQAPSTVFSTFSLTGLTSTDFSAVGGPGTLDLSASGAAIRFGFITYVTNSVGAFSSRSDYDNFSVTVRQVPAPASMLLTGLSGLLALRRRR